MSTVSILGTSWHPVPWRIQSPGAGPEEGKSGQWWCFGAPTEVGRNLGGILISCQSKQKRREVMRYLLLPLDPTPLARPPPSPLPTVCAGPSAPGPGRDKHPGSSDEKPSVPSCTSSTPGPGGGSHSQHCPGAQRWLGPSSGP